MYATNRQSRFWLMSEPRVHWANGLALPDGSGPACWRAAEDVARIQTEQQCEQQDDQSGASADGDLAAISTTAATHLRRIELGSFVVFHATPPASNPVMLVLIGSIAVRRITRIDQMEAWVAGRPRASQTPCSVCAWAGYCASSLRIQRHARPRREAGR